MQLLYLIPTESEMVKSMLSSSSNSHGQRTLPTIVVQFRPQRRHCHLYSLLDVQLQEVSVRTIAGSGYF